jgi:hypothetical protein
LSDDPGTDQLAILVDQLAIRLIVKQHLRETRNNERIDQTKNDRGNDGVEHGSDEMTTHKVSSGQVDGRNDDVDKLDTEERSHYPTDTIQNQVASQQRLGRHCFVTYPAKRQRNQPDNDQRIEDYR